MGAARYLDVGGREVRLSSPERRLWPDVTKAQLAEYVIAVGPRLIAALADRPVTLQRFPTGIDGEEFYSKNPPRGMPDWARTVAVTYPSGRSHPQLVVDEVATAVWAVQMSTLTFHPWPVRTGDTDRPDEIRFDLDPEPGRTFGDLVVVARGLRELLGELGLVCFVKTSGSRGLHIFVRISPEHEFLDARHGVIGIARALERRLPELVTTSWWKEERGGKVFVDFNQACRDRTMASAYSPRARPEATVSMPVRWEDLDDVDPKDFTIVSVPGIVEAGPDPWEDLATSAGSFAAALDLWTADLDRGLEELPFPPDYPKMPGEPPRVQPSRRRA